MPHKTIAKQLLISGKVQGVGFRQWMVRTAPLHNLDGWVRNLSDGRVEAVLTGIKEDVEAMIIVCYLGPARAVVTHIDSKDYQRDVPRGFYQLADC